VMLLGPKGTPRHKALGRVYLAILVVVCVSSLGMFRSGRWFFPHTFALVTLGVIAAGWMAARFKQPRGLWIHLHLTALLLSSYMLVGGGVNEAFLRIKALPALAPRVIGSPVVGVTHMVVMVVFFAWIVAANIATVVSGLRRRRLAAAPA